MENQKESITISAFYIESWYIRHQVIMILKNL